MRVGSVLGGLLNATLGNVTELIVAILALVKCEIRIVQSSLGASFLLRRSQKGPALKPDHFSSCSRIDPFQHAPCPRLLLPIRRSQVQ